MKKQKLIVRIVCLILAIVIIGSVVFVALASLTAGAVSVGDTGYINASYVNLRSGAGTGYNILKCMDKNTAFTLADGNIYNSSWYKIKLNDGTVGYVYKDYAYINEKVSTTTDTGYVNADYVNLRSGAGTGYSIVTCMSKNTEFTFLSTSLYNSNWYNIKLANGKTGYIYSTYATKNSSSGTNNSSGNSSAPTVTSGYVNASDVNLRSGAGTSYAVVTCMSKNTEFTFISLSLYNSNWYNIRLSNGKTGYIYSTYATKSSSTSSGTNSNTNPNTNTSNNSQNSSSNTTTTGPIKITDTNETIYKGNQYVLYAVGATDIKWSSSDTSVATVDSNGVVKGVGVGSATITAKSGSYSAQSTITVKSGSYVCITTTNVSSLAVGKSILLYGSSGTSWKSSDNSIAEVKSGIVEAKKPGYVTITAYTYGGAATCLIHITDSDNIRFTYASPNSAALNSTVQFKAITDNKKTAVQFKVSNGSLTYTVDATSKTADGNNIIWTGSKQLTTSGKWTVVAYSKSSGSNEYKTTEDGGEAEAFVTASTDKTTTVCAERRASDEVISIIANYESFLSALTPDCITTDPTIGYGKVITAGEQFYNNLTEKEAYAYLCQTVNSGGYTKKANSFLVDNGVKFNQQQFDAIVCFLYNCGASAIYNDSDLRSVLLNTGYAGSTSISTGSAGYVNGDYVNLRSGAGTGYTVVKTMSVNTKFTFLSAELYNSSWYKIKLTDGTTGYIYSAYASATATGGTRDLNNVNKQNFINKFLVYHHAAGSCYWGLLYRRIDEAEIFFNGDYTRDGSRNKYNYSYYCYTGGVSI
ncbi:MAG: SH3 domain-containing protein [Ruminococcus sp.]|nr:SH3 domain-containing protein [Ruminococcus sp.]